MDHQNNESKLDLFYLLEQLWRQLRSFWVLPLALILACSGLMTLRAWKSYQPLYTSSAMFLVTSGYSSDDILAYDYYYNNEAAQKLSDAFPYILSTDVMRERVMLELGTPVINGTITAKAVASTNLFSLSVQRSPGRLRHPLRRDPVLSRSGLLYGGLLPGRHEAIPHAADGAHQFP